MLLFDSILYYKTLNWNNWHKMMDRFSIVRQIDRQSDGQMRVKELQKNFFVLFLSFPLHPYPSATPLTLCSLTIRFIPSFRFFFYSLYIFTDFENLSISYVSPVSGSEELNCAVLSWLTRKEYPAFFLGLDEEDGRGVIVYSSLYWI